MFLLLTSPSFGQVVSMEEKSRATLNQQTRYTLRRLTELEKFELDGATITNSTIDSTPIGQTSPNTGTFTTIEVNDFLIDDILDENNLGSDSDTALATQQSIKAYVDNNPGVQFTPTDVLMLHCNAADTTTTLYNSGIRKHTITFNANAQIDTAEYQFAPSSLKFDGTADNVQIAQSADWGFGTGDFTIEFWVKLSSTGDNDILMGQVVGGGTAAWDIELEADGDLRMHFTDGGEKGDYITTTQPLDDTSWHHVVFVRTTTTGKIFYDGVSQALTETTAFGANDVGTSSSDLFIGDNTDNGANEFTGWMDEIRIRKGEAVYTDDFTALTNRLPIANHIFRVTD